MSLTVTVLNYLAGRSKAMIWLIVALSLLALGLINYLAGSMVSISFFYLLPVSLASWSLGKSPGRLVALLSAMMTEAGQLQGDLVSHGPLVFWNIAVRLGVFLVVANLISEFRRLLTHETELSRIDSLTGILNRRAFQEAGDLEISRLRRYGRPLTLAFMDLDDFKAVNDKFGHATGDAVLIRIAQSLKSQLRSTDFVARLGGDEYGVLLPETGTLGAGKVLSRLKDALLCEMSTSRSPVTFSIGVITCTVAPAGMGHLLHLADQLMYDAKARGKNCIEFALYPNGERYNERTSESIPLAQ